MEILHSVGEALHLGTFGTYLVNSKFHIPTMAKLHPNQL